MLRFSLFLISVVFLDCIFAAPLAKVANGCKQGCPTTSKGSKLKYQPGQVYSYNFDSTVLISLTGNDPEDTKLQVQGTAHVHGLSNCQYGLDMQDVTLISKDGAKTKFNNKLQLAKIVQFTLADDKLEPEICANPGDSDVSLNLKRALISLLQLNDQSSEEVDIFGKCKTNYAVNKQDDGSFVVTKTRDLNACSHRESISNGFITGVFNENSNIKSTPLLSGDYTNEIRVNKNGIIESAQVVEDYTLVPFTNGEAGVKARVVTSLRFKEQKPNGAERASVSVPKPLTFEAVEKPLAVNYKIAKKSLFDICDTYAKRKNSVGAQVAGQFTETIRLLRYLKKDDILLLFKEASQLKDNPVCRKVFLDAVFRVATADSVNAIASLLENKKIHESRLAYLSFNLASSVNKETINILSKLLDKEHLTVGYLSIGNLIKKYTQQEGSDDPELIKLFDKLADKLGDCKTKKRKQEDIMVAILKGLKGARGVSGSLANKLIQCSSEGIAGRVRAAAIQAFSSAGADGKIQSAALNLLKNRKDDSEFRIEAYLVLVENSSPQIAAEIAKLLEDEPVYQVGSFIVTHLANLRASTDLYREKARKDFNDVYATKKFPFDVRKFSFNHEVSYEFGSLGLGGSIDSNVIYSQNSFTPRSIRSNLTGELFGTSFNVLEVSGRQENFDLIMERYFGPKGYFATLNTQEAVDKLHNMLYNEPSKRHKRGISQDAEQFGKDYVGDVSRDIDFDLSVKMFGSELYFLSAGDNFPLDGKDLQFGKLISDFLKATKEGKKNQYDLHSLFLDAEFSYPTSSGFPLKIQSQGAGAFHLEASLKADFKDIQVNPKNTKFSVIVQPSYNVELTGIVSVDGYEVSTGIKVTGNVHSATGSQLTFELLNQGKGVDIKVDFPFKKQEILSFDHKIVLIQQHLGHELIQTNLKSSQKKDIGVSDDCFDQFNKYLGVIVCYNWSTKKGEKLANSRLFPLNGPTHLSAYIEIEKQYHFSALYDDSDPQKRSFQMVFDTPESQPSRKVVLNFEGALNPKAFLSASVTSPYKSAKAEIGVQNDDKEVVVYGQANSDDFNYLLKFGFQKGGSPNRREYTPIIQYSNPDAIPYKVSGKVIAEKGQGSKTKYIFEKLTVEPVQKEGKFGPLVIDGTFEYDANSFDTALDVKYKDNSAKVKGDVKAGKNQFQADLSLISDVAEFANGRFKVDFLGTEKQYKNSIVFVYGKDLESQTKRLEMTADYEYEKKDNKYTSVSGKNTLIIAPLPFKVIVNGGIHKNHIDYEFSAEYKKNKLESNLNADISKKSKGDWNVKFDAKANNHGFDVSSTRVIDDAAQKSTVKHKLQSSFGTNIVLNSKFDNHFTVQKGELTADGTFVIAKGQKPLKYEFKFSVQPKLAQTTGKILADTTEIVSFNGVLNRNGGDANTPVTGTVDVSVPELIVAKGSLRSLKGDGSAEFVLSFPKFDRKVKVASTYNCQPNKFDLHNDFYYNFEKDDSRHIAFDTKNKYTSTSVDSVNEIDINGEKYKFEFDATKSGDYKTGKQNGKFVLRLPTQREISGVLTRQSNYAAAKATAQGNLKLIDTITQAGSKSRSIEVDCSLKDGNREQKLFDMLHKLTYTDFEGKKIIVENNVSHLPKGQYKSALASVKVSGAVPIPVEFSVAIQEYCPIHAIFAANFKYGSTASVNVNGNYYLGEAGKKPSTFKLNGGLSVPQSKLKQLTFDSAGSLMYPNLKADPNGQFDYDFKFNTKLNEKNAAVDTKGKFGKSNGDLSLNVKLPETDPFNVDVDYSYDQQPEQYHAKGNVQVGYGNGKNIKFSGDGKVIEGKELSYNALISTPYENAKSLNVAFKTLKKDENSYTTDIELNIDDKKYKISNAVVISQLSPSFTLDVYYPQDKHSKVAVLVNRIADQKYKLSVHLENINNFQLASDVEVSFQSVENFAFVLDLDSAALKANKLHVDIHSKANGNNKGIEFLASEQNKNIISGTADYSVKQEKGKTTIDGKGNINWYGKSSALTFQFLRSTFNQAENGETGVSLVFNGQVGPKNVQTQLKLTNKEFHLQYDMCDHQQKTSDKPCISLKVESTLSELEWKRFTHNLLVNVDLRPLGFKLKTYTKRDGYAIEHTFDTQIETTDQNKYELNAYMKPQNAGIVLSIPKRTAAVEAVYAYPKEFVGVYQATITSYLDKKNNPSKHSTIGFTGEIKRPSKYTFVSTGSLIASHPSVKDLKISGESEFNGEKQLVSGNVKFDVFKNTNQAIVIATKFSNSDAPSTGFNLTSEVSLKSPGLGLNYVFIENGGVSFTRPALSYVYEMRGPTAKERFGFYLNADFKKTEASFVAFNEELLKGSAEIDTNKKVISLNSIVKLLDSEPISSSASVSLKGAKAQVKQGNFLSLEADATAGKSVSFKAIGNQKPLININVAMDQANVLSTNYDVNDKEFKEFLKNARTKLAEDGKRARAGFESRINQAKQSLTGQVNSIKDNLPDFSKLNSDYKEEFEKFSDDLLADKSIKELVELYSKTYKTLNKTVGELLRTLIDQFNQISKTITDLFKNLYDGFNERILPSLKESYNQIEAVLSDLLDEFISAASTLFERLVGSLKKFEGEFKKISQSVSEASKKAVKFISEQWAVIQRELEDIYKLIMDHIRSLPGIDAIKEKYQEFLQRIPHSDAEELKKLAESVWLKIKSWLMMAQDLSALGGYAAEDYYGLPFAWLQKNAQFLPQLSTLRFSILNYILHEPFPSIKDLVVAYRPYELNPLYLAPPFPIEGRIVEGEYLFTFSGDQLTVPGACHYVLAKDIVDGNFTLAAKIADKKLQSIVVADKSGETVEISATGKVSVNDKPAELPVNGPSLYAWRTYYSVNVVSKYGVTVNCKLDLKSCDVVINGYYFSKLRGLLGKGGYEQYDAQTLPNGKIADSGSEFVNAYKLHSCPDVKIDDNHKHVDDVESPECDAVFGSMSLRFSKYLIDTSKYIGACQHAVKSAANKQEAACNIGFGYAKYAQSQNVPVVLPNVCQKCEVTDDSGAVKSYDIGDHYKVSPAKKADIVFVVDTAIEAKTLKDLVQQFIDELRHSLKKDFDTKISVIGYKKGETYFAHYTGDGKLNIEKFQLPKKPENNIQDDKLISTGCKYLDPLLQTLQNVSIKVQDELNLLADGRAFREALLYPFRSNAHRTIIAIRSDVLQHSSNPIKLVGAKAVNELAKSMGINIHLVGPTPELKFDNGKDVSNVVGFNDKNVLYSSVQKASSQDREHLQYGLDLGIDMVGENHGYAFSLTNYMSNASNQRKFVKVASQHIAHQITKTESVHECVCSLYRGLYAHEICHKTDKSPKGRK